MAVQRPSPSLLPPLRHLVFPTRISPTPLLRPLAWRPLRQWPAVRSAAGALLTAPALPCPGRSPLRANASTSTPPAARCLAPSCPRSSAPSTPTLHRQRLRSAPARGERESGRKGGKSVEPSLWSGAPRSFLFFLALVPQRLAAPTRHQRHRKWRAPKRSWSSPTFWRFWQRRPRRQRASSRCWRPLRRLTRQTLAPCPCVRCRAFLGWVMMPVVVYSVVQRARGWPLVGRPAGEHSVSAAALLMCAASLAPDVLSRLSKPGPRKAPPAALPRGCPCQRCRSSHQWPFAFYLAAAFKGIMKTMGEGLTDAEVRDSMGLGPRCVYQSNSWPPWRTHAPRRPFARPPR